MRKITTLLALLIMSLTTTMVTNATLIAYEPFDYAPTNGLFGLNGGDGWGEAWRGAAGDNNIVTAPGMNYTSGYTLFTKGNKGVANFSNNWQQSSRNFSTPLNSTAGSTNWLSFVCSLQADTNNYGQFLIGFQTETDANNVRFIANGFDWDTWVLNEVGSANYFSTTPIVSNETLFVVIEKVNLINSTQDYWRAWINPPVNQHPTNYTEEFGGEYPADAIAGVHFFKGGTPARRYFNGYFDEFRVGETWDDVNTDEPIQVHTPVNESPTNFENGVALTPTLEASDFTSDDGADSHSASHFYVESIDGVVVIDTNVGAVTVFNVPAGLLEENTRYFWTVSYKGSHSTKWSSASDLTYFDTLYTTAPAPLAYEGVSYAETSGGIDGYNDGEGWRTPWNSLEGYNFWISQQDVVSSGLVYRLLEVTNNTFIARNQIGIGGAEPFVRTNMTSTAVRKLKRDGYASLLNQNNQFGGPNMTTWISGIIEAPVGVNTYNNSYRIELRNSSGNIITYIGKFSGETSWCAEWHPSDVDVIPGKPTFLVARIVYASTNSTVSLWINPTLGEEPSSNTVADTFLANDSDYYYDSVAINVIRDINELLPEVKFDELRIGIDWQQVMPGEKSVIPETPSNIAPANASVNIPIDGSATLEGSDFSSIVGDSLLKSEFRLESMSGVINIVTGDTESVSVPASILKEDTLYSWKVRYYNTISGLPSDWSPVTTFSTVWTPRDTPIAYDGADYPETNQIEGLNGGYGWANAWDVRDYSYTNLPMNIEVSGPGMIFNSLPVAGNAFIMDDSTLLTNFSYLSALRQMKTGDGLYHLMADENNFGKPGTTNWLSFLAAIGDDCTNKNFTVGLGAYNWPGIGVQAYYLPDSDMVTWKLMGQSVADAVTNIVKTNETAFLVARIISGSAPETNGTAHLWIDPVLGETPPALEDAVAAITNGFAPLFFDNIVVAGIGNLISTVTNISSGVTNVINTYEAPPKVKYDEIRFGDTWLGVTGVPEPGFYLFFMIYNLLFINYYRRRFNS